MRVPSTETEAAADFIYRTLTIAKSLPVGEARRFLKGLLLIGGENSELTEIRAAYGLLCQFDDQLELIANFQLNFLEKLKS